MAATAQAPKRPAAKKTKNPGLHGAPPRPGLRTPSLPGAALLADATGVARGGLHRLTRPFRAANLDERDPDELRESLPAMWLVASLWFRAEVRGMGNVPPDGPVLLVGNHSGGNMTPDTFALALAFSTYFGVERRLHLLTASHVFSLPGLNHLRKAGVVTATDDHAREALRSGGVACVYPGGSHEAHRPSWKTAELELGDLAAEVELALAHNAPLVPVVAIGGQETALFLTSGERLSRTLRLDRIGIARVPVAVALPWGINVGDLLGHLPLPSKLIVEVLPPIDVVARVRDGSDVHELAAHVRSRMQDTLDALAQERRIPVLG